MIQSINVHNLNSTAREIVGRYSAPNRLTTAAAAVVVPAESSAAVISPAIIVPREPDPVSAAAAAAVVPAESSAAVLISRQELRKTLTTAERFNSKCPSKHVILEIGSRTTITAVSVDGIVSQSIDGISGTTAAAAFPVSIDAKKAAALLAKIKTDCVTIQASTAEDSAVLTIQADSAEFSLPAVPVSAADDSPNSPAARLEHWKTREFNPDFGLSVSAAEMLDSLRRVEFAVDSENTRYALGGICISFCRGCDPDSFQLDFAATDSRRLGLQQRPAGIGFMGSDTFSESSTVLCSAAVNQLMEILPRLNPDSAVWICFYDSTKSAVEPMTGHITDIVIESADAEFSIRVPMVDGRFPRYRDVIPKSTNFQSVFNRRQLLNSIETAAAVCCEESRGMDFAWDFRTEQRPFRLSAQSTEFGKSSVPVRCETCGNQPRNDDGSAAEPGIVSCTFDPKYIVEWLKTSDSENVSIQIQDSDSAALFVDDSAGVYVVMPLSRA